MESNKKICILGFDKFGSKPENEILNILKKTYYEMRCYNGRKK